MDEEPAKSIAGMMSEFLREAAVLVLVFVPIDRIMAQNKPFTTRWFYVTIGLSATLLVTGMIMERFRARRIARAH